MRRRTVFIIAAVVFVLTVSLTVYSTRTPKSRQMQAHIANMQVQQMWNQHMMYIHQAMGGYHAGAGYGAHPGMGLHNGGLGQVHPGHHGGR